MEKVQQPAQRKSFAAAEEHIARYKSSGMTQMAYCEQYGIKTATFAYWLKRQRNTQGAEPGGFVRIGAPARDGALEICYTNGVVVRFNTFVDVKYVKELIR